jgi:protein dithiol oxidoreductase (disulfide-forming)
MRRWWRWKSRAESARDPPAVAPHTEPRERLCPVFAHRPLIECLEDTRTMSSTKPLPTALNRRTFNTAAAAWTGVLVVPSLAPALVHAQGAPNQGMGAPKEGRDFIRLGAPVAVPPGGKIDVIEFFWYGCPACNAFEPLLETWTKKIAADVSFRRVHVAFAAMQETHAKMFFALEQMGALGPVHKKIFNHLHEQRKRLDKESDVVAFMGANGVDPAKFTDAFRSFGVSNKVRLAKQLVDGYKIDGVPSMGVHGRWYTAPALAGGAVQALAVADYLVQVQRKG